MEFAVRLMTENKMNSAALLRAMWRENRQLKMSDTSARTLHKMALPLATQNRRDICFRRAVTRQKFQKLVRTVSRFYRKVRLFTEHSKFRIEQRQLLIISRRQERTLWICKRVISVAVTFATFRAINHYVRVSMHLMCI